ncbi:MAG: hypothetical protein PHE02_13265 [Lachnospiraceae bacterium]|nr:hypothetical protein [Lachnospiraceae bacterium]
MSNEIYQIYDRIFKRIFSLSSLAIIILDSEKEYPDSIPPSKATPHHCKRQLAKELPVIAGAHHK